MSDDLVRIAVPNKGRLSERALELLSRTGLHVPRHARSLMADVNGRWRLLFVRTGDIPEYVAAGTADVGVTGLDLVAEHDVDVETLLPLGFGTCRLVVAVPRNRGYRSIEDLSGHQVATEFEHLASRFFDQQGVDVEIVPLSGAAEIAPHIGVADAIVDLVETGSTLRQNGLVELATILDSEAVVVANRDSLRTREAQLEELRSALKGVLDAQARRYLMLNVPRDHLEDVKAILPGVTAPTVMPLLGREDWVALHAVIHEEQINRVIPKLKQAGAEGLLVLPIERMVP